MNREKLEQKARDLAFELGLNYYEDLSCYNEEELKREIKKLERIIKARDKGELYICICDLQGGDFAVGCCADLKGWREKACYWCYMDDNYGLERALKNYTVLNCYLIDFIQNVWDIKIVKFDKNVDYEKEYNLELYYM